MITLVVVCGYPVSYEATKIWYNDAIIVQQ